MNKKMDTELLLATAVQAELVELENFTTRTFTDDMDDTIHEMLRAIIKDRFASTDTIIRIHKNQEGISISIKNSYIEECNEFSRRSFNMSYANSDTEFDYEAFSAFQRGLRLGNLRFFDSQTFQRKENRMVFYLKYVNSFRYRHDNFLVFHALFEIIHAVEHLELASAEIPNYLAQYEAHQGRIEAIRHAEQLERERREAALLAEQERQRLQHEERNRVEQERLAEQRRIENERIAAEEARNREEYERRQQLLQNGATEGGIDIANQLLQFLGRG